MKSKCVFATGPESSGSRLVAKICSHVLNIQKYGDWNGVGWSNSDHHKVCHRSIPFGIPPRFPNLEKWISENEKDYEIYFILTTRDTTISEFSRIERFPKTLAEVRKDSKIAKELMKQAINSGHKYFIWSYETFMFLREEYLKSLYSFLEVESDFIPLLRDGNEKRIREKPKMRSRIRNYLQNLVKHLD